MAFEALPLLLLLLLEPSPAVAPQGEAAPPPPFESPAPEWVERRLSAMGTWLEIRVCAPRRSAALAASEAAVRAIEATEKRLSTWNEDSELARLNRAEVDREVSIGPELARDLAGVIPYWRSTGGAFDPGLGALVRVWGLRSGGRTPSAEERSAALAAGGLRGFEVRGRNVRRRHAQASIEEGGFGKGIGLDAAREALLRAGVDTAVIDLGGQRLFLGESSTVSLADPRARERAVLELRCEPGSLATSGNSERGIVVDGVVLGHLLDPRSGAPAEDFGSLSVWAPDATAADCLSTGLYVMGPDEAFRWRASHSEIELLVLAPATDGSLRALASEGLRGRIRPLVPDLRLAFFAAGSYPSSSLTSPVSIR